MHRDKQAALDFAHRMISLGFEVWMAEQGDYGFVTDEKQQRVMCFNTSGCHSSLSGNYGPASVESGTGWQLEWDMWDLKTELDVKLALYAIPPNWANKGWKYYTTVEQHLATYQASSRYSKVELGQPEVVS